MTHKILQFENETLQQVHERATLIANKFAPQGPFVGFWWENYIAEVILAAQDEQRAAMLRLAEKNKELAEKVVELQTKLDSLTREPEMAMLAAAYGGGTETRRVSSAEPCEAAGPSHTFKQD